MPDTLTWETLPRIGDGHPSNEDRRVGWEYDENGEMIPRYEPVPCGDWYNGENVYCTAHEKLYAKEYPQGWRSYPGDICMHGRYTGGSGIDWMCHECEMGYTHWVDDKRYQMWITLNDQRSSDSVRWSEDDPLDETIERIVKAAQAWIDLFAELNSDYPGAPIPTLGFEVEKYMEGYWDDPTNQRQ